MEKQQKYLEISKQIIQQIGGVENVQSAGHCATRLRIVLRDERMVRLWELEQIELVKGAVLSGNQLQLIFGAGLVDEICAVFEAYAGQREESISYKPETEQNTLQTMVKALSDIFVEIMPGVLAGALLMGLTGLFGKMQTVQTNDTLYALNHLGAIAADAIFEFLPMAVCYSAMKRFGGTPILGLILGVIMLNPALADAYEVSAGTVTAEVIRILGLDISLVGFQGGIIVALMIGFVAARLERFFQKWIPIVVRRLLAPLLTIFISTVLLFTVIGPFGRGFSQAITGNLLWTAENLGMLGYALFAGVQQLIVITGFHHIFSAVEAQLIADTGTNFLQPLMSVALMGQGGAVLGCLVLNWKNRKVREICIPSFISVLLGVSEPAIFGVNLRYRYSLICGCIGGAAAGAYVYYSGLTAIGFGTTSVPGISLADPSNGGYGKYAVAHLIAVIVAFLATVICGRVKAQLLIRKQREQEAEEALRANEVSIYAPACGQIRNISESSDATFASKVLGDGILVEKHDGKVYAPCDASVLFVFDGGHAVGLMTEDKTGILLHCGVGTVNLEGRGFTAHVQKGETIRRGQLILEFDKAYVEEQGYSSEIMMLFTEFGPQRKLTLCYEGWSEEKVIIGKVRTE